MNIVYDVIVVGAGIAGLTAALYSVRQGLKTLIISMDIGGQLLLTPEVQNYPGFTSISGYELISRIEKQVKMYKPEIKFEKVINIRENKGRYSVITSSNNEYETLAIILAFGKTPRKMGIPGEEELSGKGVSYCVICDAPLFKEKVVALVGMGYHGAESVSILKNYASKIYWIVPSAKVGVDSELLEEVIFGNKVELLVNHQPYEVKGKNIVEKFLVKNRESNKIKELDVNGVFVELGYVTQTDFLKGIVKLNEKGEIIVDNFCKTSKPGIFAAGDVTNIPYKQAVISAGMGATAALSAYNFILSLRGKRVGIAYDWKHLKISDKKEDKGSLFLRI